MHLFNCQRHCLLFLKVGISVKLSHTGIEFSILALNQVYLVHCGERLRKTRLSEVAIEFISEFHILIAPKGFSTTSSTVILPKTSEVKYCSSVHVD